MFSVSRGTSKRKGKICLRQHRTVVDAFARSFTDKRKKMNLSQEAVVHDLKEIGVGITQKVLSNFEHGRLKGKEYSDVKAVIENWMLDHQSDEVNIYFS